MPLSIDKLDLAHTAVMVIDMENDFVAQGAPMETPMARAAVPNMQRVLERARAERMPIFFTTHAHREEGSDMGLMADIWPPIGSRQGLVDGQSGIDIYPALAPQTGEPVIKKHRYSAFFGTDLEILLTGKRVDTIVIMGCTTENCCHATARDAMFRNYRVIFLADATGTFDYPDTGYGSVPAAEVHRVTLAVLGASTTKVMDVQEFLSLIDRSRPG